MPDDQAELNKRVKACLATLDSYVSLMYYRGERSFGAADRRAIEHAITESRVLQNLLGFKRPTEPEGES